MDEQRLAEAMRGVTADAPLPSFDVDDVVWASRRSTARRRSAVAGVGLAVLVVAGVGIMSGLPGGGRDATTAAAPASPEADRAIVPVPDGQAPDAAAEAAPNAAQAPAGPPAPAPPGAFATPDGQPRSSGARSGTPPGPPLGPGDPNWCADRHDPELRALVEQVLPEVVGAPEAPTTMECRPGGERGVHVELGGGVLSVEYLPPGTVVEPVPGAVSAPTASGGTVVLSSSGPTGPDGRRLTDAATRLAPRL
jgi:hypothetical protein